MSTSPKYPTITDAHLVAFRSLDLQLTEFPDLLDRKECPYPPHIRTFVRRLVGGEVPVKESYDDESLEQEITDLYNELKRMGVGINAADGKDKISIIKQSAELLGKLVGFRERVVNVREMGKFMKSVIELLETVVSTDQRSDFVEKLGKYINV